MTAKTIYYIEDDESLGRLVSSYLSNQGFDVLVVGTFSEAKTAFSRKQPSLCLVDWNLPDGTGQELCQWIRCHYEELPVVFVTVRNQVDEIVEGLRGGADDYITKPFDLSVLHARILALLRRAKAPEGILSCGDITIDSNQQKVWLSGKAIQLSPIEYRLLWLLCENKDRTLTRKSLLEQVWDERGNFVNDNTLTVTMKRLREKLSDPSNIQTVRSFGYRMEDV